MMLVYYIHHVCIQFLIVDLSVISLLKVSITMLKNIGGCGSSCLMPFWFLKGGVGEPSTNTKEAVDMKF